MNESSNPIRPRGPRRRQPRPKPKEPILLGKPGGAVEIVFLGGTGEIGKNITVFRYEDEMFVVDGGLAFPDEHMLGVDIVIPRIDYLIQNKDLIKGWVLTHGHEDHIGALPYLFPQLPKVPVYGARLTLGLVRGKLEEFGINPGEYNFKEVSTDDRIRIGRYFLLDLFRMTHSIPDNFGMVIHTPVGKIVHTGDFKLDPRPIDGQTSHLEKIAQAGAEGVLCLIADSTNGERPGTTPSESEVAEELDKVIGAAKGRIFVTTFASHIHRIQSVVSAGEKYGRKIAVEGRSMLKYARIALELGYFKQKDRFYTLDEIKDLPDEQVLVIATGSQGQPEAALSRLASGNHAKIAIKEGDTVILSSSPIPGNEEAVNTMINRLYALGAYVFYPPRYKVHASGHASHEELKAVLNLARPRFLLPWHGEVRHQVNFKWLAESLPNPPEKVLIPENGRLIRLTSDRIEFDGKVPHGQLYVDGLGVGDITDEILEDRNHMAAEGVVVITALVSRDPLVEVISKGFVKAGERLLGEVRRMALDSLHRGMREKKRLEEIRDDIYYPVKKFIAKNTGRNPVILPIVIQG
ncbi:MAG: ribonuclease J [Meiothermus sp.]|uniref:ribonuclease J n=1 Tax=Meiothermus sp. TaxID=1955249 RepID=UPI0025E13B32|nr:ribonuclease J [Meiothermus sp.]MCS7059479.1 ribonuclease J [Meiothermus sp.]MCS7194006.1 ribonuclease J [Meiothermus sp.]MDW8090214.1 ribonuclease J [Meiothermus sp.]MDW8481182.1 ribonuclease J [Meiothermus sp.]